MVKKKAPIIGSDFRHVDYSQVEVLAPTKYFGLQSKLDNKFTIQTPKMNLDKMTVYDNYGTCKVYVNVSQNCREGTLGRQFAQFLQGFEDHISNAVKTVWHEHGDPDFEVATWTLHSVKSDDDANHLSLTLPLTMRVGNITTPLTSAFSDDTGGRKPRITWDNVLYNTPMAFVIRPNTVWYRQCQDDNRNGVFGVKYVVEGAKSYMNPEESQSCMLIDDDITEMLHEHTAEDRMSND